MATINKKHSSLIKSWYNQGLGVREICERLNVSIDAGYYFFRKNNIKRRNRSENRAIQFERKKPSFKLRSNLTIEEKKLKIAGIMLYWAEGSKWSGEKNIDFANSDFAIIKIFLDFLRRICRIDEKKLRIYLYCYSNQNPNQLIEFWAKCTKISKRQFTKPYIRRDFKRSKKEKMKNGLIHVRYYDKKLFTLIMQWISEYAKKY